MTPDRKVTLLICDDHKILTDALAMVVERDPDLAPGGARPSTTPSRRSPWRPSSSPTWC